MVDFTIRLSVRSTDSGRDFRLFLGAPRIGVSGGAVAPGSVAGGAVAVEAVAIAVAGGAVSPGSIAGGSAAVQSLPIQATGNALAPASVGGGTVAVQRAPILVVGAAVGPGAVAFGRATVYRVLSARVGIAWGRKIPVTTARAVRWSALGPAGVALVARWSPLGAVTRAQPVIWGGMTNTTGVARLSWGSHRAIAAPPTRVPWGTLLASSAQRRLGWQAVADLPSPPWRVPWSPLEPAGAAVAWGWEALGEARVPPILARWSAMRALWARWRVPWGAMREPLWRWPRPPAPQEPPVIVPAPADRFRLYLRPRPQPSAGRDFRLRLGGPYYLTVQRSWRVLITYSVYRLSDGLPLNVASVNLRADRDSYGWEATVTTPDRAVIDALFAADPPASFAVVICGHVVHLQPLVWRVSRKFGATQYTITANSRTALLDTPFAVATGGSNATSLTARQLCEAALADTGFSLQWDCPVDWPIPAGRHTWSNATPKTRIRAIADAVGATLQSALASDTLIVTPRYPLAPWEWAGQTPTLVLSGMIRSAELGLAQGMAYDCVYVSGTDTGALSLVKLAGTQGERPASGVTDAYLTTGDANRERGRQVLAADANKKSFEVVIGIDQYPNPPGIVAPGTLVELVVDGTHWLDLVMSCQLDCQFGSLTQTLGFGEGRGNAYARFRNLLPTDPLLTGTVVATWEDGTATVELPGGAEIRVQGSATVGQRVYIQAGALQGEAPALTALVVEV